MLLKIRPGISRRSLLTVSTCSIPLHILTHVRAAEAQVPLLTTLLQGLGIIPSLGRIAEDGVDTISSELGLGIPDRKSITEWVLNQLGQIRKNPENLAVPLQYNKSSQLQTASYSYDQSSRPYALKSSDLDQYVDDPRSLITKLQDELADFVDTYSSGSSEVPLSVRANSFAIQGIQRPRPAKGGFYVSNLSDPDKNNDVSLFGVRS